MRTLITGVAGFVGRHLARELAQDEREELNGTDHSRSGDWEPDEALRCHLRSHRPLDVTIFEQVRGCILENSPDRIVHLAAQASGAESIKSPAETYRVNAIGTLNVLEAARQNAPRAIVLVVGSADVYGSGAPGQKIREDTPIRPRNAYALSKAAADQLGELYEESYGLRIVRTRTFSTTGPGQSPLFAIAGWADQLARIDAGLVAAEIKVGNLEGVRDYGDVRDVVRAYRLLLDKGEAGQAYNVCSGRGRRIREVLNALIARSSAKVDVRLDPGRLRPSDVPAQVGDPARLRQATGWEPRVPLEQSLADLLEDWRARVAGAADTSA